MAIRWPTVLSNAVGRLIGTIVAALLLAICAALNFGPKQWAAWVVSGTAFAPEIARWAGILLGAVGIGMFILLALGLRRPQSSHARFTPAEGAKLAASIEAKVEAPQSTHKEIPKDTPLGRLLYAEPIDFIQESSKPQLQILFGDEPPFVELDPVSSDAACRTVSVAVTFHGGAHPATNCSLKITNIKPNTKPLHLPLRLHVESFDLVSEGAQRFISVAHRFEGNAASHHIFLDLPSTGTVDYDPVMASGNYLLSLEAIGLECRPAIAHCSLYIRRDGTLRLRNLQAPTPIEDLDLNVLFADTDGGPLSLRFLPDTGKTQESDSLLLDDAITRIDGKGQPEATPVHGGASAAAGTGAKHPHLDVLSFTNDEFDALVKQLTDLTDRLCAIA